MTPEQIELVEETFVAAAAVIDDVAADLYRRLFAAEPDLERLFGSDPVLQRRKLVAELEAIVAGLRRHGTFVARTRALGASHRRSGVTAAHYRPVGVALLAALGSALGDAWTPAVEQAWRLAYDLTAEVMLAGAAPGGAVGAPSSC